MLAGIKKIRAWELADRFVVEVYRITKHFPFEALIAIQVEAAKTLYGLIYWLESQIAAGKVTKKDLERQQPAGSAE